MTNLVDEVEPQQLFDHNRVTMVLFKEWNPSQKKRRLREAIHLGSNSQVPELVEEAKLAQQQLNEIEDAESLSVDSNIMTLDSKVLSDKLTNIEKAGGILPPPIREALLARSVKDLSAPIVLGGSDNFKKPIELLIPGPSDGAEDDAGELVAAIAEFDPHNVTCSSVSESDEARCNMFEFGVSNFLVCPMIGTIKQETVPFMMPRL